MKSLNVTVGGNRDKRESQEVDTPPLEVSEHSQSRKNTRNGSTIVAVMAALVFIGIVVASMLKNTGSQSAVSRGYGASLEMSSTAQSGIVATEGYFLNSNNADGMLKKIEDAIADKKPYIFGGGNDGRKELANGQFFSSQLLEFNKDNKTAKFEVKSGKNAKGKALKTVYAFYRLDVNITGGTYGARNAVRFNGDLSDGNNGMEVKNGNATFEGAVTFQNAPAIFHGNAFFNGNVTFASSCNSIKFHDKAYFESNVDIRMGANDGTLFANDVGFNGNVYTGGSSDPFITSGGNIYLNGDFGTGSQIQTNLTMKSNAANGTFYYTDNLSACNRTATGYVPPCEASPTNNQICVTHNAEINSRANLNNVTGFQNKVNNNNMDILGQLDIGTLESRQDPEIDMTNIPDNKIQSAVTATTTSGGNFSVEKLKESYTAAQNAGTLYNGYLVLKVGKGEPTINFPNTHDGVFDKKVMFIVEDGATLAPGGRFYTGSENSSTLIYAGPGNATLNEFGSSGLFRGLIYIDKDNTASNSFNWKNGSSIEGAIHAFTENSIYWNTGSTNPTEISFNETLLNEFGSLVKGGGGGGGTTPSFTNKDDKRIFSTLLGCYYQ